MLRILTTLMLPLGLSGCLAFAPIPIKITTPPHVVGERYPVHPAPGPAPASSKCTPPARTNAAAAEVLQLVNQERRRANLAPLRMSARLTRAAQGQACENAARNANSHIGSDGADLGRRLRRQGYQLRQAAENTGIGMKDPQRLVAFWMNSPGHRKNILLPDIRDFGLGLADGPRPAWVIDMAQPR